jgi:AcrR family transcriptional regulator
MDEVALAAGVSKATIYRRWSSKVELLVSVLQVAKSDAAVTDTGSLRGDLLAFLNSVADILEGPTGRATKAVIGVMAEEPALAEAYRAGPLAWWDETINEIMERAAQRGEVAPGAAASVAVQAGPAIFLSFWYLRGTALDKATVTEIVDDVMLPLLTRRHP